MQYNYYRTYDPSTGRYLESDPIGLVAGLNTYSYVSNMPTMRTDKYGLYEGGGISEVLPGYDYQSYLDQLSDPDFVARQRKYYQDLAECRAEDRACIDRCILDNYGDLYGYAESLNPFTIGSLALSEAAEVAGDSLRSQARRNLYSPNYYDGVRQMRLYNALTRVNNAVLVTGVGAIAFQATAYTKCAMECSE